MTLFIRRGFADGYVAGCVGGCVVDSTGNCVGGCTDSERESYNNYVTNLAIIENCVRIAIQQYWGFVIPQSCNESLYTDCVQSTIDNSLEQLVNDVRWEQLCIDPNDIVAQDIQSMCDKIVKEFMENEQSKQWDEYFEEEAKQNNADHAFSGLDDCDSDVEYVPVSVADQMICQNSKCPFGDSSKEHFSVDCDALMCQVQECPQNTSGIRHFVNDHHCRLCNDTKHDVTLCLVQDKPNTLATFGESNTLATFGEPNTLATFGEPNMLATFGKSNFCTYCKEYNHKIDECKKRRACAYCDKMGHSAKNCQLLIRHGCCVQEQYFARQQRFVQEEYYRRIYPQQQIVITVFQ